MQTLKNDEVQIWYASSNELGKIINKVEAQSLLSKEEISRYQRYYFEKDKQEFLYARFLLRKVLTEYIPAIKPEDWDFSFNQYGKPLINNEKTPELNFNISHSNGFIACGISKSFQIGIDVEYNERRLNYLDLAEYTFSANEVADLKKLPIVESKIRFFQIKFSTQLSRTVKG